MTRWDGLAHHNRMRVRQRQFDLFDDRPPPAPDAGPASRRPLPDTLSDDEILDLLPDAGMRDAVLLCGLVVERGLGDRALPALDRLWRRFRGFGRERSLPEQEALVAALARRAAWAAALEAGLRLPRGFALPLLCDADPEVRELAARLGRFGRPDIAALEERIGDTHRPVRRAAAVALGWLGRASAKPVLLEELRRNPAGEIVNALSGIADDDVAVHLGRCAEAHPALAETVAAGLEEMGTVLSLRIARRIRAALAGRLS